MNNPRFYLVNRSKMKIRLTQLSNNNKIKINYNRARYKMNKDHSIRLIKNSHLLKI